MRLSWESEGRASESAFEDAVRKRKECRSQMHPIVLCFQDPDTEAKYLAEVAAWRWPVLLIIFAFDILIWFIRAASEVLFRATYTDECDLSEAQCPDQHLLSMSTAQVTNLCVLHGLLWAMNFRSRRTGEAAARQEECLLCSLIALAVSNLIFCLTTENAPDYIYAVCFLICCASYVKVRWWLAMGTMILPVCTTMFKSHRVLPPSSKQHMVVAWLAGALMSWLAESYRRCTFANQQAARLAHMKELEEKSRHLAAQQELATAREEAAQRALVLIREKAANEAKSEFMSLMCHEVRTPLNGCLASAEMLLDTPLLDEQRELTNTIRISGSILLSTVSNFLDYFKVQAGKKLDIVRTPFCLTDVVRDAHAIVDAMLGTKKKVQLLPPQSEMVVACLMGDPDRLKGVLLNLFSNAAKFTPSGFICVRLRKCLAQEVASETHINPERSYTMCLQALQKLKQSEEMEVNMNGRHCMESMMSRASSALVANALSGRRSPGSLAWWEEWLENGREPDWSSWKACKLPSRARSEIAASDRDAEDSPPNLTEIRGAARTTRSDPGRQRQRGVPHESIVTNNTNAGTPPASESRLSANSSEKGSSHVSAARTSNSCYDGPRGVSGGQEGDYAADRVESRMQGARSSSQTTSNQPNSRSALDFPGQVIVVEVVDTGAGVPEEARERLFSKFVQGSEREMQKARAASGTGLGLSICAKQMHVLGGTIGATSSPGLGSIFWFCFPVEEVPTTDAGRAMLHSSSWHPPPSNSPGVQPLSTSSPSLPVASEHLSSNTGSCSGTITTGSASHVATAPHSHNTGAVPAGGPHGPVPHIKTSSSHASSKTMLSGAHAPSTCSPPTRSATEMRSSTSTQRTVVSNGSYSSYIDTHRQNLHAFERADMMHDEHGHVSPSMSPPTFNTVYNHTWYAPASSLRQGGNTGHSAAPSQLPVNVSQRAPGSTAPPSSAPVSSAPSPQIPDASPGNLDAFFTSYEPPRAGASGQVRAPPGAAPLFLSIASDSLLYKPPRSTSHDKSSVQQPHSTSAVCAARGMSSQEPNDSGDPQSCTAAHSGNGRFPPARQTINACISSSFPTGHSMASGASAGKRAPTPHQRSSRSHTVSIATPQMLPHQPCLPQDRRYASAAHVPGSSSQSSSGARPGESSGGTLRDFNMHGHEYIPPGMYDMHADYARQMWAAHAGMCYHGVAPAVLPGHLYGGCAAAPMPGAPFMHPWMPPMLPSCLPDIAAAPLHGYVLPPGIASPAHPSPSISPSPSSSNLTRPPSYAASQDTAPGPPFLPWAPKYLPPAAYNPTYNPIPPASVPFYPGHPGFAYPHISLAPTPMQHPFSHPAAAYDNQNPEAYVSQQEHGGAVPAGIRSDAAGGQKPEAPTPSSAELFPQMGSADKQGDGSSLHASQTSCRGNSNQEELVPAPQAPLAGDMPRGSVSIGAATKSTGRQRPVLQHHRVAATSQTQSCDRSAQGSQGESLPGSSVCESLDAWALGNKHPDMFDETLRRMHATRRKAITHRGSLDSSLSASAPRQNSLSLMQGHACSVANGMVGHGAASEGGTEQERERSSTQSFSPREPLLDNVHACGPDLESSERAADSAELTAVHLHAHTRVNGHEKRPLGGWNFTPLSNVPEGGNECRSSSERRRSIERLADPLLELPADIPSDTATKNAAAADALPVIPAGEPVAVPSLQAHVQVGGSSGASRGSSLGGSADVTLSVAMASSLEACNGTFVGHAGSEGGSRSWASQRSFGDEDTASGPCDYGIDGVRVLVAEDNLINQMVAKKMLAALGATVAVVNNGQEAVNIFYGSQNRRSADYSFDASQTDSSQARDTESEGGYAFDVVLMDMAMPVMDGLQATRELRKRGCKIPIVAMTANVSDRDRATCQDSGMDGFLSKPILKGRLGRAIRQVIASGTLFPPSMLAEQATRR